MKRYTYPAVITPEADGAYSVNFPDLEGCYTCGNDLGDALFMAEDVLAFTLYEYEKNKRTIPQPSNLKDIRVEEGEFVNYIACDTLEYQRRNNNRAVKKTLSIPEWMHELAVNAGVNFSQVLQEALAEKLHIV